MYLDNFINNNLDNLIKIHRDDSKTNSSPPNSYQQGITSTITGETTDFPLTYGAVITIKVSRTQQFNYDYKGRLYTRQKNTETTWQSWYKVNS